MLPKKKEKKKNPIWKIASKSKEMKPFSGTPFFTFFRLLLVQLEILDVMISFKDSIYVSSVEVV